MSDETKESRINIEDLPQAEEELTAEDAKNVKGGFYQVELPPPAAVKASDGSVKSVSITDGTSNIKGK
jgi:hypothetical protein